MTSPIWERSFSPCVSGVEDLTPTYGLLGWQKAGDCRLANRAGPLYHLAAC